MHQVFEIAPSQASSSSTVLCFLIPVGSLAVIVAALFGYFSWASTHVRYEVSSSGLRITGSMYGRQIPIEQLDVGQARLINVKEEPGFALSRRTNGVGLPYYSAGWFKLRNGQKALAFVTGNEVVYIPTSASYYLMLSVVDPQQFIAALRQAAAAPK